MLGALMSQQMVPAAELKAASQTDVFALSHTGMHAALVTFHRASLGKADPADRAKKWLFVCVDSFVVKVVARLPEGLVADLTLKVRARFSTGGSPFSRSARPGCDTLGVCVLPLLRLCRSC